MPSINDPAFIHVEGISDFRSLGGYPITSFSSPTAHSTHHDFLYRSADPYQIAPTGRSQFESLQITTAYDLRSKLEVNKQPVAEDPIADGIARRFVPIFADEDWSPEAIAQRYAAHADYSGPKGYVLTYGEMLEHGAPALKEILLHIRDRPHKTLLVHCSARKDRTGMVVALCMKIAGVDDEVVAREYELSEVGMEGRRSNIVEHLVKKEGDREKAEKAVSAKYENMLAVLQMMKEKYGGAEGYVKSRCGFGDEDVATVRRNLLADSPPDVII